MTVDTTTTRTDIPLPAKVESIVAHGGGTRYDVIAYDVRPHGQEARIAAQGFVDRHGRIIDVYAVPYGTPNDARVQDLPFVGTFRPAMGGTPDSRDASRVSTILRSLRDAQRAVTTAADVAGTIEDDGIRAAVMGVLNGTAARVADDVARIRL